MEQTSLNLNSILEFFYILFVNQSYFLGFLFQNNLDSCLYSCLLRAVSLGSELSLVFKCVDSITQQFEFKYLLILSLVWYFSRLFYYWYVTIPQCNMEKMWCLCSNTFWTFWTKENIFAEFSMYFLYLSIHAEKKKSRFDQVQVILWICAF